MKATPLLFKAEMIQALLREIKNPGTGKTMTRRSCKEMNRWVNQDCREVRLIDGDWYHFLKSATAPLSKLRLPRKGDLIWCKETARVGSLSANYENQSKSRYSIEYKADGASPMFSGELPGKWFPSKSHNSDGSLRWHPSIFMPRWASRITLLIEDVRVERLQDITWKDAVSEGIKGIGTVDLGTCKYVRNTHMVLDEFQDLWKSINGEESWNSNPHVVVRTFKPILANVDAVIENPEKYGINNANR